MISDERLKAIEAAFATIEKKFGKGAIMRLGEHTRLNVETVPTGALSLDVALGIGGLPKGRIIEIFGRESSGKTTLTLHAIAEVQKRGGEAAFIDAEHALDPSYAKKLGVDTDNLILTQPDTGEQALEIAEALVRSNAVDIIVIDSVAALVPKAEIDGEMGDSHMGLHARLMSQALRKLSGVISKTNAMVIFINQVREKIGGFSPYGPVETTTGGRALKFYASIRLDVKKGKTIQEGSEMIGNHTKVKIVKNKLAPPFKEAEFDIVYGQGISKEGNVLDVASSLGVVKRGGSWYSYGDEKMGQGRDSAIKFLKDNPEKMSEIEKKVYVKMNEGEDIPLYKVEEDESAEQEV